MRSESTTPSCHGTAPARPLFDFQCPARSTLGAAVPPSVDTPGAQGNSLKIELRPARKRSKQEKTENSSNWIVSVSWDDPCSKTATNCDNQDLSRPASLDETVSSSWSWCDSQIVGLTRLASPTQGRVGRGSGFLIRDELRLLFVPEARKVNGFVPEARKVYGFAAPLDPMLTAVFLVDDPVEISASIIPVLDRSPFPMSPQ